MFCSLQETRAYPFSPASVVLVNDALQLSLALFAVSLKLGLSSIFKDGSLATGLHLAGTGFRACTFSGEASGQWTKRRMASAPSCTAVKNARSGIFQERRQSCCFGEPSSHDKRTRGLLALLLGARMLLGAPGLTTSNK